MPGVSREEMKTWQRVDDTRRLLRKLRSEVTHLPGEGSEPEADAAARAMVDALEEHLEWFQAAAEERDALKLQLRCEACGKVIPKGTGLEKNGKLTPLCPSCQSKRIGEAT